jgi:type IV secretion system protein VirB1
VLTIQAALALALHCAPGVDPHMMVGIAGTESGLDPMYLRDNTSGQVVRGPSVIATATRLVAAGHSVDLGLMQINSHNLLLLGLGIADAFDACKSITAASKLIELFSRYNTGSPTKGIVNGYAQKVTASIRAVRTAARDHIPGPAPGVMLDDGPDPTPGD